MIPGEIFTSFTEFQVIVSVNGFRIPIGLQELLQASLYDKLLRKSEYNDKYTFKTNVDNDKSDTTHTDMRNMQN